MIVYLRLKAFKEGGRRLDMLLLLGGKTGHLDYNSIDKEFASYIGNTGRVIAADGSVIWYPEYYAKKPILYSLASMMVSQTKIDAANSKSFREMLPSDSNRGLAGFINYNNLNGIICSENILRAAFMSNIGDVFNALWGASRPISNMNRWKSYGLIIESFLN